MSKLHKKRHTYGSLEEIQMHKEQLREVIQLEDREIKRLWSVLTTEDEAMTRGELISRYISYGIMAFDGVMTLRKLKQKYGKLLNIFRR